MKTNILSVFRRANKVGQPTFCCTFSPIGRGTISLISSRKFALLPLALLTLTSLVARADELDTLQFSVGEKVVRESNVFRLSDSANTQAVLGTSNRSDTIAVTSIGLKLRKSYSLQRFEVDVGAEDHHYSRFSNLNFTAVNYAAAWRWSVTPALHGNLTTDRREYIDTVADVQNTGQLNRRTSRSSVLDAEYEIDGAWRIVGGVFERESSSSQPFTFEGNSRVRGAEAGVRYVYPSGTSLAYRFRNGNGDYPGRPASPQFADNFTDREHEFRLDWAPTGKTTVRARLSHFDRTNDGLAARDFSGVTGQLDATWDVTGKTKITAGLARELGSYQTTTASYFQGDRFFIGPTWKPTEKTAVRLRYEHGVREFKGPLPGFAGSNRRDTANIASLALEWQPLRALTLAASAQRENRRSSEAGADYKNNSVGISANISF